ncbi:MAG TPA: pirin family protein [Dongiaceae bacterium]|nr:pirin family protein [Dongiaceae bacterium]
MTLPTSNVIRPHEKDIGFSVKRLLPAAQRQRVGPFIFLDHMGPATFAPDSTANDVRPHPHIGLATVTYLFSGAMQHKDSTGVEQRIEPGAVNLMTAGRGVVHSERIPADIRNSQTKVEGIQTWLALPEEAEETEPGFQHYTADSLPQWQDKGVTARVLIGSAFGLESPVKTASPTTYLDLQLDTGATLELPALASDLALYIAAGSPHLNGEALPGFHLVLLDSGASIRLEAGNSPARVMLLGGEPLPGVRHINWNFVSSRRERIDQARTDWQEDHFPKVQGETERIPLPR